MKFVYFNAKGRSGASLLEVLIALSLLATSILGAAAAQLSALRHAREQVHREHASWIAASIAEAMRLPEGSPNVLARQRERAAAVLPDGRVSAVDEASGIGTVVVEWASGQGALRPARARNFGSCAITRGVEAHGHCIELPVASNGR